MHPGLSTLTATDEPLQRATSELIVDLREVVGLRVTEEDTPGTGHKGGMNDLVIALGGPSVVAGVVTVVRLWLSRDRRRSLIVRSARPGEEPVWIEITGDNIAERTVHETVQRLLGAPDPLDRASELDPGPGSDSDLDPANG
ncbi:effector-associated constant component EACC1 [Micromonospora antibiotica]|nr:hypothetical protein [Micromonospora antibiotica]